METYSSKQELNHLLSENSQDAIFLINKISKHPIPLIKVDIIGNVVQQLASFEMRQHYINNEDFPIETIYLFPVDVDSVFTNLEIEFTLQDGSKKQLVTRVDLRQVVEEQYEKAIATGKTAVVGSFTKTQKDMVRVAIGNFPPNSSAVVKCFFHQKLDIEDISYCLRLPMSYVPKYMGDIQKYIDTGVMYNGQQSTKSLPLSEGQKSQNFKNIMEIADYPMIDITSDNSPYLWNLNLNIQMTGEIERISSRNQEIKILNVSNNGFGSSAQVTLGDAVRNHIPNQDFILYIRDDTINQPNEIQMNQDDEDDYLEPKLYDYIFLIDRSGSMRGKRIRLAVQALQLFLHSLPMGCKFNVVSFGSTYTKMFKKSKKYDNKSLQSAIKIEGTDPNLPRHLYLLTDGEICDTQKLIDMIKTNRSKTTVHSFGIGDGVSTELIKDSASAGNGHYSFIIEPEEIERKVLQALQKDFLDYVIVKDINILDQNKKIIEHLVTKDNIAHGEKFNMIRHLDESKNPKYVEVTFLDPNNNKEDTQRVPIRLAQSQALVALAAKQTICESANDQANLSVKYQILHGTTAMIAYEQIMDSSSLEMLTGGGCVEIVVVDQDTKTEIQIGYDENQLLSVVFCQQADGSWNDGLYKNLKNQQFDALKAIQTLDKLFSLNEEELLTVVAIKMLQDVFIQNQKEWKLVVAKGKSYLKRALGISDNEVQNYVNQIQYQIQ
eukprot:403342045